MLEVLMDNLIFKLIIINYIPKYIYIKLLIYSSKSATLEASTYCSNMIPKSEDYKLINILNKLIQKYV